MTAMVKYKGSCHCGDIEFEVLAPRKQLIVVECSCSMCVKKQTRHFIVPAPNFKLVSGHTSLTTYSFGSHLAKHMFCSKCGVQSFFVPKSNPDKMAIMPHCLDEGPLPVKVQVENGDGLNSKDRFKKCRFRRRCYKLKKDAQNTNL